jgi:hypothetical protein
VDVDADATVELFNTSGAESEPGEATLSEGSVSLRLGDSTFFGVAMLLAE